MSNTVIIAVLLAAIALGLLVDAQQLAAVFALFRDAQ